MSFWGNIARGLDRWAGSGASPRPESPAERSFAPLTVVGLGLVSAGGRCAAEHVFLIRAGLVEPTPSPFRDAESDTPIPARYFQPLGARAPLRERVLALALRAAGEALAQAPAPLVHPPVLLLITRPTGLSFSEQDRDWVERALLSRFGFSAVERFEGASGVFQALDRAGRGGNEAGQSSAFCLVAADSRINIAGAAQALRRSGVPWLPREAPLGEAGAALLVVAPEQLENLQRTGERLQRRDQLGRVLAVGDALGEPSDQNDLPIDGQALVAVVRGLGERGSVAAVYGPLESERLRRNEWGLAQPRLHELLAPPHVTADIEAKIGQVGASSGAVHLVYGLSVLAHGAAEPRAPRGASFWAWSISEQGHRGAALVQGAE